MVARIIHDGSLRNGEVARDKRIRDTSRGIRDAGYGIRDASHGIRDIPNFVSRLSRQSRPSRLSQTLEGDT
jgi:hypothetical protein